MNKTKLNKTDNIQNQSPQDKNSSNTISSQDGSSTRKRTPETNPTNLDNNTSITQYSITTSQKEIIDIENIEVKFNDLPEAAKPLVRAVSDFVDSDNNQTASEITEIAKKYILECNEPELQQRIGIYHATGIFSRLLEKTMDDQHKAVFIAILNKIRYQDETIQKAIIEPIADAIVKSHLSFTSFTNLNLDISSKCFDVELIIKQFFQQAYQLTQQDVYRPYAEAKGDRKKFYEELQANHRKLSPVLNAPLTPWYIDILNRFSLELIFTFFVVIIIYCCTNNCIDNP